MYLNTNVKNSIEIQMIQDTCDEDIGYSRKYICKPKEVKISVHVLI